MSNSEKKTQISVRFTSEQLKGIEEYQQSRILYCEHRADAVRELVDIALHRDPSINKIMGLNPQHKAFLEVLSIPIMFFASLIVLIILLLYIEVMRRSSEKISDPIEKTDTEINKMNTERKK